MFCQNKSIVRKEYVAPDYRTLMLETAVVLSTSPYDTNADKDGYDYYDLDD